jgi:hypothetical protein
MDAVNSGFEATSSLGSAAARQVLPIATVKFQNHTDTAAESVFDGFGGQAGGVK